MAKRKARRPTTVKENRNNSTYFYVSFCAVLVVIIAVCVYLAPEKFPTWRLSNEGENEGGKTEIQTLKDPIQMASFELSIAKQDLLNRFNAGERFFTKEELDWMEKTDDQVMFLALSGIYKSRGETDKSIATLERIIQNYYDLHERAHPQTFNMLIDIYTSRGTSHFEDLERVLQKAIKTRKNDEYTSFWYGKLGVVLLQQSKYNEAQKVLLECLNEFENIENQSPHPCLQQLGIISASKDQNVDAAMEYWIRLYESQLKNWYDNNQKPRKVKFFPLGINENYYNFTRSQDYKSTYKRLKYASVYQEMEEIQQISYACGHQKYAIEVQYPVGIQLTFNPIFQMKCFSETEKSSSILKLKDVEVSHYGKHLYHDTRFGYDYFYVPGFPYAYPNSYPIIRRQIRSLPEKQIENAIILTPDDSSYFFLRFMEFHVF